MSDDQNKEAPLNETPTDSQTSSEASESTDMEKIQSMINEQLQPLKDQLNEKDKLINELTQKNKQKDDDINNYRKNMMHNIITEKPIDPIENFVNEYTKQIEAGLNAAWKNSGYANRTDLKDAWFKTAWEYMIDRYK